MHNHAEYESAYDELVRGDKELQQDIAKCGWGHYLDSMDPTNWNEFSTYWQNVWNKGVLRSSSGTHYPLLTSSSKALSKTNHMASEYIKHKTGSTEWDFVKTASDYVRFGVFAMNKALDLKKRMRMPFGRLINNEWRFVLDTRKSSLSSADKNDLEDWIPTFIRPSK